MRMGRRLMVAIQAGVKLSPPLEASTRLYTLRGSTGPIREA
jgi:hypothetical protein